MNGKSTGFFAIFTGLEGTFLYLYPGSFHFVFSLDHAEGSLSQKRTMKEKTVSSDSIFIAHGYLQHNGSTWSGKYRHCFHTYLMPEDVR